MCDPVGLGSHRLIFKVKTNVTDKHGSNFKMVRNGLAVKQDLCAMFKEN